MFSLLIFIDAGLHFPNRTIDSLVRELEVLEKVTSFKG